MAYDPNKLDTSSSHQGEMDPEKLAHIVDVVNAVKVASRSLPVDVRHGLIERRASVHSAKNSARRLVQRRSRI